MLNDIFQWIIIFLLLMIDFLLLLANSLRDQRISTLENICNGLLSDKTQKADVPDRPETHGGTR